VSCRCLVLRYRRHCSLPAVVHSTLLFMSSCTVLRYSSRRRKSDVLRNIPVRVELRDQAPFVLINCSEMMHLHVMFHCINFEKVDATFIVHLVPRFISYHSNGGSHSRIPRPGRSLFGKLIRGRGTCVHDCMMILHLIWRNSAASVCLYRAAEVLVAAELSLRIVYGGVTRCVGI
jgi:hypothetical protein